MSNREEYSSWNEDQYEYEQRGIGIEGKPFTLTISAKNWSKNEVLVTSPPLQVISGPVEKERVIKSKCNMINRLRKLTKSEIKEVPPAKKGVSLVKSWKSSLK